MRDREVPPLFSPRFDAALRGDGVEVAAYGIVSHPCAVSEQINWPRYRLRCGRPFSHWNIPDWLRVSTDASESGYFAVRGMLAKTVIEAARFIAERGIVEQGAPVIVRFIAQVASRFGAVVTQKVTAQALPIMGALGGAVVNYAFIEHFQQMAKGHFTVRRLERFYGKELIKAEYERMAFDVSNKPAPWGARPAHSPGLYYCCLFDRRSLTSIFSQVASKFAAIFAPVSTQLPALVHAFVAPSTPPFTAAPARSSAGSVTVCSRVGIESVSVYISLVSYCFGIACFGGVYFQAIDDAAERDDS
jgi:hypothetical protein